MESFDLFMLDPGRLCLELDDDVIPNIYDKGGENDKGNCHATEECKDKKSVYEDQDESLTIGRFVHFFVTNINRLKNVLRF